MAYLHPNNWERSRRYPRLTSNFSVHAEQTLGRVRNILEQLDQLPWTADRLLSVADGTVGWLWCNVEDLTAHLMRDCSMRLYRRCLVKLRWAMRYLRA